MRLVNMLVPLLNKSRLCQCHLNKTRTLLMSTSNTLSSDVPIKDHTATKSPFVMDSTSTNFSLFRGSVDRFNGITVHSEKEPCNAVELPKRLEDSLAEWKQNGKRGIWFKVHLSHADWVPILAKNGFKFHHTKDDAVMMLLWLPEEDCNVPLYAHTLVGVGAVVVNDKSQVLVVSEKYYDWPHWKLPGGYVEPGENIIDAAIREVQEETNISTEFDSVLSFRHSHRGMFGCSDIYMVISLKPLSQDITICEREIAKSQWMDIEEYLNHPQVHELNRFVVQKFLEYNKHNIKVDCFHGIHEILKKPYNVYYVMKKEKDGEGSSNKVEDAKGVK